MTYISLHYKIITSKYSSPSDTYQCYNFSSMIKNKIDGWVSIYLYNDRYIFKSQLIDNISKQTCIPKITIVEIDLYNRTYVMLMNMTIIPTLSIMMVEEGRILGTILFIMHMLIYQEIQYSTIIIILR